MTKKKKKKKTVAVDRLTIFGKQNTGLYLNLTVGRIKSVMTAPKNNTCIGVLRVLYVAHRFANQRPNRDS